MQLPSPQKQGLLIKRYKRFLADVELPDGEVLTVHCPNSGSMLGCSTPGSPVLLSRSANPKRKYPWTLELVQTGDVWIGVNTSLTNRLVHEALESGIINDFGEINSITPEKKVSEKSRLDFLLETSRGQVYLEVKNCSMAKQDRALFPDAVTVRGTKHLHELMRLAAQGYESAVLFCVQRADASSFSPARAIDPVYAETLTEAASKGVHILAYQADVHTDQVTITTKLSVVLDPQP